MPGLLMQAIGSSCPLVQLEPQRPANRAALPRCWKRARGADAGKETEPASDAGPQCRRACRPASEPAARTRSAQAVGAPHKDSKAQADCKWRSR